MFSSAPNQKTMQRRNSPFKAELTFISAVLQNQTSTVVKVNPNQDQNKISLFKIL
jgi:hypothetical protein